MTKLEAPADIAAPLKRRANDRRCVGTGDALPPEAPALRFVLGPDDVLTLDLKGKLPGRGAWLAPRRDVLLTALKRGGFQRGFKKQAKLPEGLDAEAFADRVEGQLQSAALQRLGLARKSGHLLIGHDTARAKADKGLAYLTPSDASEAETTKLARHLEAAHGLPHLPIPAPRAVLGEAAGQDGVHFLLLRGGPGPAALGAVILWLNFRA